MAKKKLFTFNNEDVLAAIESVDRGQQSAFVEACIAKQVGIEFGGETPEAILRSQIKETLTEQPEEVEVVPAPVEEIIYEEAPELVQEEEAPVVGEEETAPSELVEDAAAEEIVVEEPPVVEVGGELVEEAPTPDPLEEVEIPVHISGQPANEAARALAETPVEPETPSAYTPGAKVCPTCGQEKATDICLNCL